MQAGREAGKGQVRVSQPSLCTSINTWLSSPALPMVGALPKLSPIAAPPHQVTECLQELEGRLQELEEAWVLRWQCCAESWGLQKLLQRLEQAEAWLACREGLLLKPDYGVSGGPAP